jgi:hypothetical protein
MCKYSVKLWLNVNEMYIKYPQNAMDGNPSPSRLAQP